MKTLFSVLIVSLFFLSMPAQAQTVDYMSQGTENAFTLSTQGLETKNWRIRKRPSNPILPTYCSSLIFVAIKTTTDATHTRRIDQFLGRQAASWQTVAAFCADNGLKIPTFYAWKKKYAKAIPDGSSGFCELRPVQREVPKRKLCPPSGAAVRNHGAINP